jgi:MFS family permease
MLPIVQSMSRVPLSVSSVPPLIKRNMWLFALSQSFTGAGMQFAFGLGPLMVVALTGSAALAGLSVVLLGVARFLVAYPIGRITDRYGRKPGIQLGLALALVGGLLTGCSMSLRSFSLMFVGMLIFGMGMYASQQLRVAATDMFPARMRGRALGYVGMGLTVGVLASPLFVIAGEHLALRFGGDPLGVPWLLMPLLILPGMLLVTWVRPDPKQIGTDLDRYFPGEGAPPRPAGKPVEFSTRRLLAHVPSRLAIVATTAAVGNMAVVMVLTSLVLQHHGHSLGEIAWSHAMHATGMFAFSIPVGWMADRFGRERVMYPGVAVTLVGAGLVAFTTPYWFVTLGTFLVGLGWAGANIAATAAIADYVATEERGRAIGVADSFAGGINVVVALITGPLVEWYGLPAAGLCAVVIAAVPLAMRLAYHGNLRAAQARA